MSWWTWPGLRGAVLEQIPGRLLDIGAGGCSLETSTRLASGTFGFVEVQGPDASIAEVARVCDVTERPGAAAPFLVRLEFLPIALPAGLGASDRRAMTPEGSLAAAVEKAGPSLTLVRRRGSNGEVEKVGSAHGAPDSHGSAAPELPGEPLAERLKK
ncbi:MAG TPA: PilZ domain-containing protein [Vicinamibacterales bacterium]|nr:PilZ domain-containing protein [Vicinamibacterales bacterium]